MDQNSRVFSNLVSARAAELFSAVTIGVAGACIVLSTSLYVAPKVTVLITLLIPVIAAVILRPRVGVLLLIFAMCFIEELPGGFGEDEAIRSQRTAFYAVTFGVRAFYIPDAMIFGLLILFLLKAVIWRTKLGGGLDKIAVAFCLLGAAVLLSLLISFTGPEPLGPPVLDLSLLGAITLPLDVARHIGVLQYKLFLLIFPAYLLGLFFFREERDIRQTIILLTVAMVATILLGAYRLALDPAMIKGQVPVIFDTASITFMAMTVFYLVGMWACGHLRFNQTLVSAVFCAVLILLILLSFRRTMWGAIALAAVLFPLILPRRTYWRLLVLAGLGGCAALILLGATPGGQAVLQSLIVRAGETNLNQGSTLYRFALGVWLVDNIWDLPLFGYGIAPLWNKVIHIRFFSMNLEDVHSLYLWILLRMGVIGFLLVGVALSLVLLRLREVYRLMREDRDRILVGVIFLCIVMYLFSGIFNPVYANVRLVVPLGFALALVTRLPYIAAKRKAEALATPSAA